MGRKTKLTKQLQDRIIEHIRNGNYPSISAQLEGVAESTYYSWMKKGREAKRKNIYREFHDAVREAEAFSEAYHVNLVRKRADQGDLGASKFFLSRKFPERWGKKSTVGVYAGTDEDDGLKLLALAIRNSEYECDDE